MKILAITCCLFMSMHSFSQVFYKSFKDPQFQKLATEGITYLLTGDEEKDQLYLNALEKNWKISQINVVDPKEDASKLSKDDIVLLEATMDGNEGILAAIKVDYVLRNSVSKYNCIAYICTNGFNQNSEKASVELFLDQIIGGLHDAVATIQKNQVKGKGSSLYKALSKAYEPRGKELLNKTLLIVDNTKKYVNEKALEAAGIKYKLLSTEEYKNLITNESDLSGYALFYFAYNSFTEVAIYDLTDNSLIHTRHYANAKYQFNSMDIKGLLKE